MIVLNVVCFGTKYRTMHEHVLNALGSGRIANSGRFRLDQWPDMPRPGMLDRPALVTYVPAHGGCWPDAATSGLGVKGAWASFEEFGGIGGSAVVLDACDTATDEWLYDGGLLRAECQSLKGKPLLGGSGLAEAPTGPGGAKILNALLDLLADVEDSAISDERLLSLLRDVRHNAIMKSARNSRVRTAYAVRRVTDKPSEVW
jgi:hypothetical protein